MYLNLRIKVPNIIEYIFVYFLLRYRKKRYGFAFRKIKLITNEKVGKKDRYAIIDPEDYQKISKYNWQLFQSTSKKSYAARLHNRQIVHMHRVIMNAPKDKLVDHKDRNGLNNTKQNLRFATHAQNCYNRVRTKKGTSTYRGVSLRKKSGKWQAGIRFSGINKFLGSFDDEQEAARAYDAAAKIYHGEFAVLNFPSDERRATN